MFAAYGTVSRLLLMLMDRGNHGHHLKKVPLSLSLHVFFALLFWGLGLLIRWPLKQVLPSFNISVSLVLATTLGAIIVSLVVARRLWTPGRLFAYLRTEAQRIRQAEQRETEEAAAALKAAVDKTRPRRHSSHQEPWKPKQGEVSLTVDEDRAWNDAMKCAQERSKDDPDWRQRSS